MISDEDLINTAKDARDNSYSYYSGYSVGAAIIDNQGKLHIGVNVENVSYPLGNCAEAAAISAMVLGGGKKIKRIAIAGGKTKISSCMPCGGCRQRIFEFANKDTVIITMNEDNEWQKNSIYELLPIGFDSHQLG
jgi:cytidine deaminase